MAANPLDEYEEELKKAQINTLSLQTLASKRPF